MISRITGRVVALGEDTVELELGGVCYEIHVPAYALPSLHERVGTDVTLSTIQYFEGNLAGSNLTPRLLGFESPREREFFELLTSVKGISMRRALRLMGVPVRALAAALVQGDVRTLTSLPEVGRKTATQLIADLQEPARAFVDAPVAAVAAPSPLTDAQRVALDILVQWGDRRADAERWIAEVCAADGQLTAPDDIVRAAYRLKQLGTRV